MLGDTLAIIYGGPGGTSVTLKKINQDQYSSEYFLRATNGETRIKVRHSKEKSINGAAPLERHNVEFTRLYLKDDVTYLEDTRVVLSFTIRSPITLSDDIVADWVHGLVHWLGNAALTGTASDTRIDQLVGWES